MVEEKNRNRMKKLISWTLNIYMDFATFSRFKRKDRKERKENEKETFVFTWYCLLVK